MGLGMVSWKGRKRKKEDIGKEIILKYLTNDYLQMNAKVKETQTSVSIALDNKPLEQFQYVSTEKC